MTDLERVGIAMGEIARLLRLRGRRLDELYRTSRVVVVKAMGGQSRHTRRNNLRIARLDSRPKATAAREETERRAKAREAHVAAGTAT